MLYQTTYTEHTLTQTRIQIKKKQRSQNRTYFAAAYEV